MIDRYNYPLISGLFSPKSTYEKWRQIELDMLKARDATGDIAANKAFHEARLIPLPDFPTIRMAEGQYGHDVVGFLAAWTKNMTNSTASQIHMGMTSSDLVDNTLFMQLDATMFQLLRLLGDLFNVLDDLRERHMKTYRIGRTHGQHAEPTILSSRFIGWRDTAALIKQNGEAVRKSLRVVKTPGAVGTMRLLGLPTSQHFANIRKCVLVQSTQVIPRQRILGWAGWVLQAVSLVEEIALEIRLSSRTEVGEMREGGTSTRIGSSAMPGKANPIGAEQLSGLGRVARAQFAPIAETAGALHHERDISNSSVERTALVDLAVTSGYMLSRVVALLRNLTINVGQMWNTQHSASDSAYVQWRIQQLGVPYLAASNLVRKWVALGGWDMDMVMDINSWLGEEDVIDMARLIAHVNQPVE